MKKKKKLKNIINHQYCNNVLLSRIDVCCVKAAADLQHEYLGPLKEPRTRG
jgi:hypothetical protein